MDCKKIVNDEQYLQIIPTAILTAYPRTFSDIPYTQAIFDELKRNYGEIDNNLITNRLAIELEARSKLIDKLLAKTGINQVLEIASGYSSRGLIFAQNSNAKYIELDLPDVAKLKTIILSNIASIPDNLHIIGGNALRNSDLEGLSKYFSPNEQIAIINEGLLRYLDFDEKTILATNIRGILERFGGVWISGDGATKSFRNNQNKLFPSVNTTIMNTTKRNDIGNAFENQEHFKQFFGNLGFTVEFYDYTTIQSKLTSPRKLGRTEQEVRDRLLSYASVIVFRLAKSSN
jgi:O-methyltransferase involved in polyketide biosynthesis